MAKPTIDQILTRLTTDLVEGNHHLAVAKGLANADPVVLNFATAFFRSTLDAHLYWAQMALAKLFDTTKHTVTVPSLLAIAETQKTSFPHGSAASVQKAIDAAREKIGDIQQVLTSVKLRRDKALAHLDPRTVVDAESLLKRSELTIRDLQAGFQTTRQILNELSVLWKDTTSLLEVIGGDDYKGVLDVIADFRCKQAQDYETEFHAPAPFPKPKKCS